MMELYVNPMTVTFDGSSNVSYVSIRSPADTVLENNGYYNLSLGSVYPSPINNSVILSPSTISVVAVDNPGEKGVAGAARGWDC